MPDGSPQQLEEQQSTVALAAGGQKFSLAFRRAEDHIARSIRSDGAFYESEMLWDIRSRLFFPKNAIDIGAHVGNHTVFLAGVLGAHCLSFEPNASNFSLLRHNVERNGLQQLCTLRNAAVGATKGRGRAIDGAEGNSGMARVERVPDGDVPIVSIDDVVVSGSQVDLLKIDVEGWELEVLRGGEGTLNKSRPVVYVETSAASFSAVRSLLSASRYVCWKRFNPTPTFLFLPAERLRP
jgi:FkbM family methyltransferase